ncbi:hypothetical protein ABIA33_003669 [Streptacidiphilus sp. MAP12-16]|uniref:PKD domain-containing protein n=1 Tax=Streptacidiphilus sp. MAP12-16 TaxID=3156300 RepID=UPI0035116C24
MRAKRMSGLGAFAITAGLVLPTAAAPTPVSASGSTIYVNVRASNCSDTATAAGTQDVPYCTIQPAVNVAQPGQTVLVAPGFYRGEVDVTHSGTSTEPITIAGDNGEAHGPANSATLVNRLGAHAFVVKGVHDVAIQGFNLQTRDSAVTIQDSSRIAVRESILTSLELAGSVAPGIDVSGSSDSISLTHIWVQYFNGSGVSISGGVTGTTVNGSVIMEQSAGVTATDAPGTVITGNTVLDACLSGISLAGASTGSTVENNVLSLGTSCRTKPLPTGAELSVSAGSAQGTKADYNLIGTPPSPVTAYSWAGVPYPTAAGLDTAVGQGLHDIVGDPGLASDRNPVLAAGSPAIDSADAGAPGETTTDITEYPRIDDPGVANTGTGSGTYDRGAYEFHDPFTLDPIQPMAVTADPVPVTVTVPTTNPWGTSASYSFDFGDGTTGVSSSPSIVHSFENATPGRQTLTVTATLPSGYSTSRSTSLTVMAAPPLTATLTSGLAGATAPQAEKFTGTTEWPVTSATVDPGDGSGPQPATISAAGTITLTYRYQSPGSYTATLKVTDVRGEQATSACDLAVGEAFVPVTPTRVLDTRSGVGAARAQVGPGHTVRVRIEGTNGLPKSAVTAVTMNVTATGASADSWVAAYPEGIARPNASNLNFQAGQTTPNLVTVPVGNDGYVDLYNAAGSTDLVADVQGYYTSTYSSAAQGYYQPVTPARVLDTRSGTGTPRAKVGPAGTLTLHLPTSTYPGVRAVVLNITATGGDADSWVAVYPGHSSVPNASNLNFRAGQTTPNLVTVPVAPDGTVTLYNAHGHVDLLADIEGYYTDSDSGQAAPYIPVNPTRVFDTRYGVGVPKQRLGFDSYLDIQFNGTHGVPGNASAVVVNLTASKPSTGTWVTAWPAPWIYASSASNLNPVPGTTRPNLVMVPVGRPFSGRSAGYVDFYNADGELDLFADLEGYFAR